MEEIKVIVVTYKDYDMPNDSMYYPILVGDNKSELRHKYATDDTGGDNISDQNATYSELTALYWAWKNLNCKYVGLVQYRRHLTLKKLRRSINNVLSREEALNIMKDYDVIAVKRHYLESVRIHYINSHKKGRNVRMRHIELLRDTIVELSPDYVDCFDKVMNSHAAYMFNMYIMEKCESDKYCDWLFTIIFTLEKKIKLEDIGHIRLLGALSEFLLST